MAIDSLSSISSLSSLPTSRLKKAFASHAAMAPDATDFGSVLSDLAKQTATTLRTSEDTAMKGIQGKAPMQDVVQSVMRAQTSLQAALALRDKTVSAYQDLTKMTI